MTKPTRPSRKRSPRPNKSGKKSPSRSEAHKLLWADPAYRAKMQEARARTAEDRRRNPAKYSRLGVPDGMRKAEAMELWDVARAQADEFMQTLEAQGVVEAVVVPDSDEEKAKAALRGAVVIALGPTNNRTKGMAINTVLRFTKAPPAQRVAVAPSIDHAWLTQAWEAHRGAGSSTSATEPMTATQPEQTALARLAT
jgi:hypothetical protein